MEINHNMMSELWRVGLDSLLLQEKKCWIGSPWSTRFTNLGVGFWANRTPGTSDDLPAPDRLSCHLRISHVHRVESTESFLKFSIRAKPMPVQLQKTEAQKSPVPVSIFNPFKKPSRRGAGPNTCRVHDVYWIWASAGLARKDKHAVVVKPQPDPHGHLGILMVKHLEKTIVIVFEIPTEILHDTSISGTFLQLLPTN